jgi:pectate lyase
MKKILFLSFFLIGLNNASAQNYYMTHPEGFGAAATGGGAPTVSNTVTVDTYAKLKTALSSTATANAVILVSGTISCDYTDLLLTNKTIIGLPGARLVNNQSKPNQKGSADPSGILYIKPGSNNVIIRNLIFEGPGAFDVDGHDNLTNEGTSIWVDHCEFQDGMDGNFDNKGKADNITISWCKFTYLKPAITGGFGGTDDHRYSDLVGSDKADSPADGHYSITFQNCYWADGCKERMPRARNSELHLLNCYYNTNVASSLALGLGGGDNNTTCYVENTNFAKISTVFKSYIYKKDGSLEDGGTVGLAFDGCLNNSNPNIGTVSKPTYSYTVLPVANVATYVSNASCGAGATLQVSATGVISTNCANLDVKAQALNMGKLYPTAVDAILNIDLSDSISGDAVVNIFSISGNKVLSYSKNNVSPSEKLSVNVANLSKGIYLCNLKVGEIVTTWKFIKK